MLWAAVSPISQYESMPSSAQLVAARFGLAFGALSLICPG
jgi:hypothetical protein